jgi:hypothetical protein
MPTRRSFLVAAGGAALAAPALAFVPRNQAPASVYDTRRGVAVDGTDVVAYFTESRPVRGSSDHSARWGGSTWRFSSAANRDAFAADPLRYAPQYGGWCAWAVAEGYLAPTEPEQWTIRDGRLYLNANASVQQRWLADPAGFIAEADRRWPTLV